MLPGSAMHSNRVLIIALALAVFGCKREAEQTPADEQSPKHGLTEEQANEVLAKVGDRVITVGELADRLASQSPYLQARFESPERRKELLDNLVRYELLVYEAKRRGYDDDPEVARARRNIMIQELIKDEVDEPLEAHPVTDEEVQASYDANPTEFDRPAQVRASHIFVTDKKKAEAILKKVTKGDKSAFARIARESSEDEATAANGGDLGFFTEDAAEPAAELRRAAFSLEHVGDVTQELISEGGGYHIAMLTAKRAELKRTYAQAKRAIRHKLTRERKEAAVAALTERLHKEIAVQIDYAALDDVKVDTSDLPGER